jgi:hypothetical protein
MKALIVNRPASSEHEQNIYLNISSPFFDSESKSFVGTAH